MPIDVCEEHTTLTRSAETYSVDPVIMNWASLLSDKSK